MKVRALIVLVFLSFAACATVELQGDFTAGRQALLRNDSNGALSYFEKVARADPKYTFDTVVVRESIWTYVGRAYYNTGRLNDAKEAFEKALSYVKEDHVARLYLGLTLLKLPVAAAGPKPFTLQEVSFALREGVDPKRVAALIRERGVGFDVTRETETQLRSAGGDSALVDEIKKIRTETLKKGSDNQGSSGPKELTAAFTELGGALDYAIANTIQGKFWDPGGEIRAQVKNGLALLSAREPDRQKIIATGEWVGTKLEEEADRARRDETDEFRRRQTR
jgi:tetratricopeptide (TPR) repeat protein